MGKVLHDDDVLVLKVVLEASDGIQVLAQQREVEGAHVLDVPLPTRSFCVAHCHELLASAVAAMHRHIEQIVLLLLSLVLAQVAYFGSKALRKTHHRYRVVRDPGEQLQVEPVDRLDSPVFPLIVIVPQQEVGVHAALEEIT